MSSEEKQIVSVSLANGAALPEGVTLDPDTLELSVSKDALKSGEALELQVLVTDKDGNQSVVPVILDIQNDDSADLQGDGSENEGAAENGSSAPSLTQQVKEASQLSVSEKSRILLTEFSAN
jgi:hypothetical protein